MSDMGTQNFVKILHQFKQKQVSPLLCDAGKSLCGRVVYVELFSETHKIILIYWLEVRTDIAILLYSSDYSLVNGVYTIMNRHLKYTWNSARVVDKQRSNWGCTFENHTSNFLTFLKIIWRRVSSSIAKTGCGDWFCQFVIWITIIMTRKTMYNMLYVFI